MPLADASEIESTPLSSAVQQLRHSVGIWSVTTTQFDDKGEVARVGSGTYRFDWVVPDRVLSGRSDMAEWKQSAGMLFYVNPERSTIEMTSVGPDGQLWVMTGPAGGETRTTAADRAAGRPQGCSSGSRASTCRPTASVPHGSELRRRRELAPGNHQTFKRAAGGPTASEGRLRYRKPAQDYVRDLSVQEGSHPFGPRFVTSELGKVSTPFKWSDTLSQSSAAGTKGTPKGMRPLCGPC